MIDDSSLAVLSMAVTIVTIARKQLARPEVLRTLVERQDCPAFGALVTDLHQRGHRDRARGLLDQLDIIRSAGGWAAALERAHPHARETWLSAAGIAVE
jgi:hypothetical protein